ncbi:conserved Plasmodium protein, unknown function [Plasmodium gallinaceum]|uniref:Uncharacterized protein n=1 Tax=Plasmodium gallinaceum TaxID=5849 RepID=A0A1J1GZI8_PLAGA|nr:conserved Plasmodium protein, unknown function [Plasmodium gallinaceum]CRG98022.1 conserved Plasmodium protein, unknown function [Plasmodium gallinaceum]
MFNLRKNIYRFKKLLYVKYIKTSEQIYNEYFIFNFENVENLKKLKDTNKNETLLENTQKERNDILGINIDKKKLKKTRKVLALVQKKLKNYEKTPLNRLFYILYKNTDCLSDFEIINILYLAIKNRKYYLLKEEENNNDINKNSYNNLNDNKYLSDISYVDIYSVKANHDDIYSLDKENEISFNDELNTNIYNTHKNNNHIVRKDKHLNNVNEENVTQTSNINIKKNENDYVYKLLYLIKNRLLRNKTVINLNILHIYKLSYSLKFYKINTNNFISLYLSYFLKKEIDRMCENKNECEIKNDFELDFLLNLLIIENKNLKTYFFNLLYDYIFAIIKNDLFNLSCKNICLLLSLNHFEKSIYDNFFFMILNKKREIKNKITLTDANYFFFYQIKNKINLPFFDDLIEICVKSNINSKLIQNIHLLSLLLLHYDYSKLYFHIYDNYVELIFNMYSHLLKNIKIFLEDKKINKEDLNINFLISFSLSLSIIRNNLYFNENFFIFVLYLVNNQELNNNDLIILLNFINFCNFKNEIYYKRNPLYNEKKKNYVYIYDSNKRYMLLDCNDISYYIYEILKKNYLYEDKKGMESLLIKNDENKNKNSLLKMCSDKNKKSILINNLLNKNINKIFGNNLDQNNNEVQENYVVKTSMLEGEYEIKLKSFFEKKRELKRNKSYYLSILDLLIFSKNNNFDDKFYQYLLALFHKNIINFNINIFDLDKILFTYIHLNLNKDIISLNILNIIEKLKINFLRYNHYIDGENYFFDSLSNILLSIIELNLSNIVDVTFFEKKVLENINKVNINSILILLQYFILKRNDFLNIKVIIFLLLEFIKKKYYMKHSDINDFNNDTILEKLRYHKNYDFIKNYIREKKNYDLREVDKTKEERKDYIFINDKKKNENNINFNYNFKKINEDDMYEFLLLRFVFLNIILNSNVILDNFKFHDIENFRELLNNFNKIIYMMKKKFTDIIHINLKEYNEKYNIPPKEEIENKNAGKLERNKLYINIHNNTNEQINNNTDILNKKDFVLIINYFLFIFKFDLKFIIKDKNFIESIKLQHLYTKKFKSTYYNYKYLYVYRQLMLSLIYDMKKKNCIKCNYLLNFNKQLNNHSEKININEFINILRYFNYLCLKKKINNNIFSNYLKNNNINIYDNKIYDYDILCNDNIIYNLNGEISNIYINVTFFNYIIPMLIKVKDKYVAIKILFNTFDNVDTYNVLFGIMRNFLKNYNYDIILIKRKI